MQTISTLLSKLCREKYVILILHSGKKDKNLRDLFEGHLSVIERENTLFWLECKPPENQEEIDRIVNYFSGTDIIISLVSSSFISKLKVDSYVNYVELINTSNATHIPIILKSCYGWQSFLGDLESLPRSNRAIDDFPNRDVAFTEVVETLSTVIGGTKDLRRKQLQYFQVLHNAVEEEYPLSQTKEQEIADYRSSLGLSEEDSSKIDESVRFWKEQNYSEASYVDQTPETGNNYSIFGGLAVAVFLVMVVNSQMSKFRADDFFQKGVAAYERKEYQVAIENYTQAIKNNASDYNFFNNRGNAYYFGGDVHSAVADYTQAINLNPNDIHGYRYRGESYMKLGKFREAVKDFEQAAILYQQEGNAAGYQAMLDQLAPLRQPVP